MTEKTLIVYDGDNLNIALRKIRPNGSRLRMRTLDRILTSLLYGRSTVRSDLFASNPGDSILPSPPIFNPITGMWLHLYPIVNHHGYDDEVILTQINLLKVHISRLVIVSSDNDFFDFASELGASGDIDVTIFAIRGFTAVHQLNSLPFVNAIFLDSIIDLYKPPPTWERVVSEFTSPIRW